MEQELKGSQVAEQPPGGQGHLPPGLALCLHVPPTLPRAICAPHVQQVRTLVHVHVLLPLFILLYLAPVEEIGQDILVK